MCLGNTTSVSSLCPESGLGTPGETSWVIASDPGTLGKLSHGWGCLCLLCGIAGRVVVATVRFISIFIPIYTYSNMESPRHVAAKLAPIYLT